MSVTRSAKVPEDVDERLSQLEEDYDLNKSDAQKRALEEGLRALGYYPNSTRPETKLRHVLRSVSTVLGFSGLLLIGLTLFTSAELRFIGFLLVVAALLVRGIEQGIARVEPRLTRRLTRSEPTKKGGAT